MPEKTFKIIELCGVSEKSYAEATKNAVTKASQTLRNLDWFEVVNQRGFIKNGKVAEFRYCSVHRNLTAKTKMTNDEWRMTKPPTHSIRHPSFDDPSFHA